MIATLRSADASGAPTSSDATRSIRFGDQCNEDRERTESIDSARTIHYAVTAPKRVNVKEPPMMRTNQQE